MSASPCIVDSFRLPSRFGFSFCLICVSTFVFCCWQQRLFPGPWTTVSGRGRPRTEVELPYLPCDWTADDLRRATQLRVTVYCDAETAEIRYQQVQLDSSSHPVVHTARPACLARVIPERCGAPDERVPRVAHYVHFGDRPLGLDSLLSVLSVARFLRPCLVLFHGDRPPPSPHWSTLLRLLPNVVYVPFSRPRHIFGRPINVVEHSADVARLRILLEYGGVYLDTDHLVLRPLQPLLSEQAVVGTEILGHKMGNGFLLAQPGAAFLQEWLDSYHTFDDEQWAHHSTVVPYLLATKRPHLVHVEHSFFSPPWNQVRTLYYNGTTGHRAMHRWRHQYGMHIYTRMVKDLFYGLQRIDRQNNTMGDIVRYILYGNTTACLTQPSTT